MPAKRYPFTAPSPSELADLLGGIDIYLLDQVLKGRIANGMKVLDAGCGGGRNLVYLMQAGFPVFGVDQDEEAVNQIRLIASDLAPMIDPGNFRVEPVEKMSFADASFDVVISNAVLHFANDEKHFRAMLAEMWRVLAPGGMFFARLMSTIGIADRVRRVSGRRFALPGGWEVFLVDEEMLLSINERLNARLVEPIKTVNVQNQRAMTTWCLEKPKE